MNTELDKGGGLVTLLMHFMSKKSKHTEYYKFNFLFLFIKSFLILKDCMSWHLRITGESRTESPEPIIENSTLAEFRRMQKVCSN